VNLQLDHFPMIKNKNKTQTRYHKSSHPFTRCVSISVYHNKTPKTKPTAARSVGEILFPGTFEHGSHNVSRWMTWLPISLKNAAKCDKWYQLQNLSITESLNANGAREKLPTAIPVHAVSLSVEQKPKLNQKRALVCRERVKSALATEWLSRVFRQNVDSWITNVSKIRKLTELFALQQGKGGAFVCDQQVQFTFHLLEKTRKPLFCYRPECGRITRRT
jgi:hypothetical protein